MIMMSTNYSAAKSKEAEDPIKMPTAPYLGSHIVGAHSDAHECTHEHDEVLIVRLGCNQEVVILYTDDPDDDEKQELNGEHRQRELPGFPTVAILQEERHGGTEEACY